MKHRCLTTLLTVLVCFFLSACGGLRYSKCAPDAGTFHPRNIAVLSVNTGPYEEAVGRAEKIITEVVKERGWFETVLSPESIGERRKADDSFAQTVEEYLLKLEKVNFSDPDLSRRIADDIGADAFLIVRVDFWHFTINEKKKEVAKVGFVMNLVDPSTGKILWTCAHHEAEDYLIIKPDLAGVAKDVAKKMIDDMPH